MADLSIEEILRSLQGVNNDAKAQALIHELENSTFAKIIVEAMKNQIASGQAKKGPLVTKQDVDKFISLLSNTFKNEHMYRTKETTKFLNEIKKALKDAVASGVQISRQGAIVYGTQGTYSAIAQSQKASYKGKGAIPLNVSNLTPTGAAVVQQAQNYYLPKGHFAKTMTTTTNKLISFFKNQAEEAEKKDKKKIRGFLDDLIKGLLKHKFFGGVIMDLFKLAGYWIATQLGKLGPWGKALGGIAIALSATIPGLIISNIGKLIGAIGRGVVSIVRAIGTAAMGRIFGRNNTSKIATTAATTAGVAGGAGAVATTVGATGGAVAGSNVITSFNARRAAQLAQQSQGTYTRPMAFPGANIVGYSATQGGSTLSKIGSVFGKAGSAMGKLGTPWLIGANIIGDLLPKSKEGTAGAMVDKGINFGLGAVGLASLGAIIASAFGVALSPMIAPILGISGGILAGVKIIKGLFTLVSEWFNKDKNENQDGVRGAIYDRAGEVLSGLEGMVNLPARGPGYSHEKEAGYIVHDLENRGVIAKGVVGKSSVKDIYELSPHALRNQAGTTLGAHSDPLTKIDLVSNAPKNIIERELSKATGLKVQADWESKGKDSHWDIKYFAPDGTRINRPRVKTGARSSIANLAAARSKKPIVKNGWVMNAYELEQRAGAKALWDMYQKDPEMRKHYEWSKDVDSFNTDIWSPEHGALLIRGTSKGVRSIRSQGYNARVTSGMGSAGHIINEAEFAKLLGEDSVEKIKIQEQKKKEEKKKEEQSKELARPYRVQRGKNEYIGTIAQASKTSFEDATGNATYSKALMNVQQIALNGADSITMG